MTEARRGLPLAKLAALVLLPFALLLFACEGEEGAITELVEVTRLVTLPAPVNMDADPATRLVVVTATPPLQDGTASGRLPTEDDPGHYRALVADGPRTLDPALAADRYSRNLVQNVVEPLLMPDPREPDTLLPLLATGWLAGEDGLTYTFLIRRGISFSNGNTLTPEDVAYTLQRGLLQSAAGSPFTLLLDPLLGYSSGDVTEEIENGIYAGDRDALLANASTRELLAVCEKVKAAIVADDGAGTVTFTLARPWSPLPAALSQPWTGIVDRDWAGAQGAWDGDCRNWATWYAPATGESLLATRIMGTGPFILDHWTPGAEYVLVRNDAYWRQAVAPPGQDGPAGMSPIHTVTVRQETAAELRWEALRDGSVESAELSPPMQLLAQPHVGEVCTWPAGECRPGENVDGPLRRYADLPRPQRQALFFNFNISGDDNPFIGSGQLDGAGIPPTFFDDEHVRRAFAHCFDREQFIQEALNGHGRRDETLLPAYYGVDGNLSPVPTHDREACTEALAAAWDGLLPATGFWLQIPYESGNRRQQQAALILQEKLSEAGENYTVEIVGLTGAAYRQRLAEGALPVALLDWEAALPDPHSWVAPAFGDEMLAFQRFPSDLQTRFTTLLNQGVSALEPADRRAAYRALEAERREILPHVMLPAITDDHYQQRWVNGWFYHPLLAGPHYYAYSLAGG